jgi:hypothetical protein
MTSDRTFCTKIRIETGSSINPCVLIGLATKGKQMRLLVKTDMVLKTLWFIMVTVYICMASNLRHVFHDVDK